MDRRLGYNSMQLVDVATYVLDEFAMSVMRIGSCVWLTSKETSHRQGQSRSPMQIP